MQSFNLSGHLMVKRENREREKGWGWGMNEEIIGEEGEQPIKSEPQSRNPPCDEVRSKEKLAKCL